MSHVRLLTEDKDEKLAKLLANGVQKLIKGLCNVADGPAHVGEQLRVLCAQARLEHRQRLLHRLCGRGWVAPAKEVGQRPRHVAQNVLQAIPQKEGR